MRPCGKRRIDFRKTWSKGVRARAKEYSRTLEWWYRDHYRLPATDPRLLAVPYAQMQLDFWAYYYSQRPNDGADEYDNPDFEADVAAILGVPSQDEEWVDVP